MAKGYSGDLAVKIRLPDHGKATRHLFPLHLYDAAQQAHDEALIDRERARKFILLFARYGIDPEAPEAWERLARALAIAHVTGFQTSRDKGHPLVVTDEVLYRLYRCYRRKRASKLPSKPKDAALCAWLEKDTEFATAVPELAAVKLKNYLSRAHALRRKNLQWRWNARHRMRRLKGTPIDEHEGNLNCPPWPGHKPMARFQIEQS